jgi:hypothetical protein
MIKAGKSLLTAQKMPSSRAQQIATQVESELAGLVTHVSPSGLVMTRLPVPLLATAQKSLLSGDQQIALQLLSAGVLRAVHL